MVVFSGQDDWVVGVDMVYWYSRVTDRLRGTVGGKSVRVCVRLIVLVREGRFMSYGRLVIVNMTIRFVIVEVGAIWVVVVADRVLPFTAIRNRWFVVDSLIIRLIDWRLIVPSGWKHGRFMRPMWDEFIDWRSCIRIAQLEV